MFTSPKMTHFRWSVLLLAVLSFVTPVAAGPPADKVAAAIPTLEKYIEGLQKKTGIPGIAVAVVHKDRVVYQNGFGVREVGKPDAVDADRQPAGHVLGGQAAHGGIIPARRSARDGARRRAGRRGSARRPRTVRDTVVEHGQ